MGTLRIAALVLLLLLTFQPRLLSQRIDTTQSIVAVLIDVSKSMEIRDTWIDLQRKADLIRALGGNPQAANQDRITTAVQPPTARTSIPEPPWEAAQGGDHLRRRGAAGQLERKSERPSFPPLPLFEPKPPVENATRLSAPSIRRWPTRRGSCSPEC